MLYFHLTTRTTVVSHNALDAVAHHGCCLGCCPSPATTCLSSAHAVFVRTTALLECLLRGDDQITHTPTSFSFDRASLMLTLSNLALVTSQLLENFAAALVYHQPDDPRQFLIAEVRLRAQWS